LPNSQITLNFLKPKPLSYPKELKTIGDHLRKRRLDLGIIQKEVAQRIRASVASIWLWENGRGEPELKWIPAIIEFLGHDPRSQGQTLGECLVSFRKGRGWSQKRLADELRIDPTTLSRWELGKKAVWGDYRDRVSALLYSDFNEAHQALVRPE
jgi:transcriptional regulator with XRE-family HTH domain